MCRVVNLIVRVDGSCLTASQTRWPFLQAVLEDRADFILLNEEQNFGMGQRECGWESCGGNSCGGVF